MIGFVFLVQLPDACVELLGFRIGLHDAGNAVAVGDPDAGESKRYGLFYQLIGVRCAAQEGEVGGDGKLCVSMSGYRRQDELLAALVALLFPERDDVIHANTPCTNQRVVLPAMNKPSRKIQTRTPSRLSTRK